MLISTFCGCWYSIFGWLNPKFSLFQSIFWKLMVFHTPPFFHIFPWLCHVKSHLFWWLSHHFLLAMTGRSHCRPYLEQRGSLLLRHQLRKATGRWWIFGGFHHIYVKYLHITNTHIRYSHFWKIIHQWKKGGHQENGSEIMKTANSAIQLFNHEKTES